MMLCSAVFGFAQRSETAVCGIKMGTEKSVAKKMLQERFGYASVSDDAGDIFVFNGSAGGIKHKFMTFQFVWIDGSARFNGAIFSTPFELSEQKEAIKNREYLKSLYEQKYILREYKNDDGFKCYCFGESILDGLGIVNLGVIEIHKAKGNDGKSRLYLDVAYFGSYDETDDI